MDLELAGKRALISGGSRGIGKQIAALLAAEGAAVTVLARGAEALQATAAELGALGGGPVIGLTVDVGDRASVDAAVAEAAKRMGGLDILVNCAASVGGGGGRAIADLKEDAILDDLNVKLMGYMRMARAVAPHMIAGGFGRIINLGGHAMRVTGNYSAALRNAAITAWASNLAGELGPQGITVNTVHPSFTFTERRNDMVAARALEANNTARVPEAADVAFIVAMLASPRGWVVNGESIMASGGLRGVINY